MTDSVNLIPHIKNYRPLDLAGDSVWIPTPQGCAGTITDRGYSSNAALDTWGIKPVCNSRGEHITHPEDSQIKKFSLSEGWSVVCEGKDWSIRDHKKHERITLRYDPDDCLIGSWLRIPFDMQTRISRGEVPPKDWWVELSYLGQVVFVSEKVQPYTDKVLQARELMSEREFSHKVFLPQINALMKPLEEAATEFLKKTFPRFPEDPDAYW